MKIQHGIQSMVICGVPSLFGHKLHEAIIRQGTPTYYGSPEIFAEYRGHRFRDFVAYKDDKMHRVLHTRRAHLLVSVEHVGAMLRSRNPFPQGKQNKQNKQIQ